MTFGSLFAGIGGFDLGLERAGMTCKWQCEIDPFCNKVLAKHWPDVKRYGDIKEIGGLNLEPVDLICGGFPCQPFSVAGKQRGQKDDRYLWPEMLRVITELRPYWVIGENVPGIVKMELDKVLSDLENQGYETQTFIIPACAVDAPHRRDRVWIVAHNNSIRCNLRGLEGERIYRQEQARNEANSGCENATDAHRIHDDSTRYGTSEVGWQQSRQTKIFRNGCKWLPEPAICELDDGFSSRLVRYRGRIAKNIPNRVAKLKALGNAVVPQVVEIIGRFIIKTEDQV